MISQNDEGKFKVKGHEELFESGADAMSFLRTKMISERKSAMAAKGMFGPTSFEELDEVQMAREVNMKTIELVSDFTWLVDNVVFDPDTKDNVGQSIRQLANEFADRFEDIRKESLESKSSLKDRVVSVIKSVFGSGDAAGTPKPPDMETKQADGLKFYKQGGKLRWVARYSNNLRDDDNPSEIIAAESHRKHVALVKAGIVNPPNLWLWHEPQWQWGVGDWVTLDEQADGVVFTIAGGTVLEGYEELADVVSKDSFGVSHGMPRWSVSRSNDDPSIIVEHVTEEVSPLPMWAAANKFTDFNYSKEATMIPANEKLRLMEKHGVSESLLKALEQEGVTSATKASSEGREYKEAADEPTAESEVTTPETEEAVEEEPIEAQPETAPVAEGEGFLKEKDAVVIIKSVTALAEKVDALAEKIDSFDRQVESAVAEKAATSPLASLLGMMQKTVSPIGQEEARVDGREKLAKNRPVETPVPPAPSRTGIPMVDGWLTGSNDGGGN